MSFWTIEQDTRLIALHGATGSPTFREIASAINSEFKTDYSRNACIGRAGRLNLTKRTAAVQSSFQKQKPKRYQPYKPRPKRPPVLPIEEIQLRCVEVEPRNISLMDLEPNDCRYPFGNGPFTFCGHPALPEISYCLAHFHLCRGAGTGSERAATSITARMVAA